MELTESIRANELIFAAVVGFVAELVIKTLKSRFEYSTGKTIVLLPELR